MIHRWLFPVAAAVLAVACSSSSASEDLDPVDEATADVVSASKLVGEYHQGRGRFATLSLQRNRENGRLVNRFEAQRFLQCAETTCPTVTVKGRWFARGSSFSLYPENEPRETYRASLAQEDEKLTLSNAQGVKIVELVRKPVLSAEIEQILAEKGIPKMTVDISAPDLAAQSATPGVEVPFGEAFRTSIDLFLHDEAALSSTVAEFEDEVREHCGAEVDLVLCIANSPDSSVYLHKIGDETAPDGESAEDAWVFSFFAGNLTDHGYFAIVPKKRSGGGAYIYAFN